MRNAAVWTSPGRSTVRPSPLAMAFVGAVIGSKQTRSRSAGAYTWAKA